jgi:predicted Fe-Mo cluster-binding NifX family protein
MVECTLFTDPFLPLHKAHRLADNVEEFLIQKFKYIESVFIHIEPMNKGPYKALIPTKEKNGLGSIVYSSYGKAPFFAIIFFLNNEILSIQFIENVFVNMTRFKGIWILKSLESHKLDILFTSEIGELPMFILKEKYIDVYQIKEGLTIIETIEKFNKKVLKKITKPTHFLGKLHNATNQGGI